MAQILYQRSTTTYAIHRYKRFDCGNESTRSPKIVLISVSGHRSREPKAHRSSPLTQVEEPQQDQ